MELFHRIDDSGNNNSGNNDSGNKYINKYDY
jgi:hypothetical protein